MGELGALFNPGMRHELEERRSKAMRREEEGNARDSDLRIDLESGVAVINAPGRAGGSAPPAEAATDGPGTESGGASDAQEPGPAATTGTDADDRSPAAEVAPAGRQGDAALDAPAPEPAATPVPLRPRGKRALTAGRP